jgi:hypothetical protein
MSHEIVDTDNWKYRKVSEAASSAGIASKRSTGSCLLSLVLRSAR